MGKKLKGKWMIKTHKGEYDYYAAYSTVACSQCGSPFFGRDKDWMGQDDEHGSKVFSAFFNGIKNNDSLAIFFLQDGAERNAKGKLPKFCGNCGIEMKDQDAHTFFHDDVL